ncbi:response regulator [Fusibacter bizertensis]
MKVLLVEDEFHTLLELKELVSEYKEGMEITALANSEEALKSCESENYQIALLDIEMPRKNGIELAMEIYRVLPEIKIAFVTAYNHFATEAFDAYAIDYILKPVRKQRLYKSLDRLVAACGEDKVSKIEINIKTFGKFEVTVDGEIVKWKRQKAYELCAFLVMHTNQPIHKEKIIDILFPEFSLSKATVQLHTAISYIRKLGIKIEYFNNSYRFVPDNATVDLAQFEAAIHEFKSVDLIEKKDLIRMKKILKSCSGDFYDEDGFSWSLSNKEHLKNQYRWLYKKYKENTG